MTTNSNVVTTAVKLQLYVAVAWGMSAGFAGCMKSAERPAPPTFPAKGVLALESGASPENATIEFIPKNGSKSLSGRGSADAAGNFELTTPYPDRQLPGLAEGTYRAVVMMPLRQDRTGGERYELKQEFVVGPSENSFTITVPEN